ncbi:RNA polymerase sigma-70 factor, ECF subfamily [Chitinophaga eiseniae]|uniref:RNA polymerase sigma-70 factor, ECF subfamily n=1 Tax=Chitinophaga eiseniae TaxID=634771 RepID=A0A1T4RB45_9BACT|nr:RNA polymerase sigma-70 factor [Chitinophaga eiseniae]SKA13282.1 RNA polymerase sigma-70 factor, ECF subfamily [Chitinophaga eiseniae]
MTQDPFILHRSLLFTVAYEMLGSATDAEDVVQEAWLRWSNADQPEVHDPRAYLVRIVTRLALNHMRTLSRRREEYIGEWLPEPLLTGNEIGRDLELRQSVSMAMLIVLETLGPTERAVFILHDVFGMPHGEISQVIGKSVAAVRQIARRARQHVTARQSRQSVSVSEQQAVVERFLAALQTGQLQQLMEVLAPDVVLTADGGGLVPAAKAPVHGAAVVASLLVRSNRQVTATPVWLNGEPAGRIEINGTTAAVSFEIKDGRIVRIYAVANPRKLTRINKPVDLSR